LSASRCQSPDRGPLYGRSAPRPQASQCSATASQCSARGPRQRNVCRSARQFVRGREIFYRVSGDRSRSRLAREMSDVRVGGAIRAFGAPGGIRRLRHRGSQQRTRSTEHSRTRFDREETFSTAKQRARMPTRLAECAREASQWRRDDRRPRIRGRVDDARHPNTEKTILSVRTITRCSRKANECRKRRDACANRFEEVVVRFVGGGGEPKGGVGEPGKGFGRFVGGPGSREGSIGRLAELQINCSNGAAAT
jgi:hypothetical protein